MILTTEIILMIVSFCGEFDRFEQCNKYMFECYKKELPLHQKLEHVSEICEETLPVEVWEGQER